MLLSAAMFICEICGNVFPEDCPTCPDRGSGRGVTTGQILEAFRACTKVADVNDAARHFRQHVTILDRAGGPAKTEAIIIRNMAAYMRHTIGEPWKGQNANLDI
jgi:hypothetical protein